MCATCGCADDAGVRVIDLDHGQGHGHQHDDRTVVLEQKVLARNDSRASANRAWLAERGIAAINLMSSPGSGKTTLLERTIRSLDRPVSVIEGDQETVFDADRIRATGCRAVQVNTGAGCHLDAEMVASALDSLAPAVRSLVFIENVGNLVCPALFDLGEAARAVLVSVTEGEDKPLKYPHMFRSADVVLLNKVDLLPYLTFSVDKFVGFLRQVCPTAPLLPVSAARGDGLADWSTWLEGQVA